MFLKLFNLTVVISSLVLVYGGKKELPKDEASERFFGQSDEFDGESYRPKKFKVGTNSFEAENYADSVLAYMEKLMKQSPSDGKQNNIQEKKSEPEKPTNQNKPKATNPIVDGYEQKIKALEDDNEEFNVSLLKLQKEIKKLEGGCKKDIVLAKEILPHVKNFLKTEPANSEFKYKIALELERIIAEHAKAETLPFDSEENGKKYQLFTELLSWNDAKEACDKIGMFMPVLFSKDEEKFLTDMLVQQRYKIYDFDKVLEAWIGVNRVKDEWLALSGDPLTKVTPYVNWAPMEPNNREGNEKCVSLVAQGGMNDLDCSFPLPYFCKKFV